jgi:DNA adenine methylase
MPLVTQADQTIIKPPLKWAGGKRWLLPHLESIWEKHKDRRLVEPFCGGLAITLGLMPEQALLNDINHHAINFYHWLQKGLQIRCDMRNDADFYYICRKRFNELTKCGQEQSKEAAELFYFLNRTGYNGLCRFNGRGEFNVPFGSYKSINYRHDFRAYKNVMANWQFVSEDFQSIKTSSKDFIYADPPYDVEFTQYAKEDFTWADQMRLAQWLSKHRGPVILSNQATPRIISLYQELDFKLQFFDAPRMISCTGDRTKAREVLATRGVNF